MLPGSGPVVRLGEAEAADPFAGGELGQVLRASCASVPNSLIGTITSERLHAHHRAVARVDAFDLARHQAVADVVQARAAVGLGDGRPEHSERPHLAEDRDVGLLVAKRLEHARRKAPWQYSRAAFRTWRSSSVSCSSSSNGSSQLNLAALDIGGSLQSPATEPASGIIPNSARGYDRASQQTTSWRSQSRPVAAPRRACWRWAP